MDNSTYEVRLANWTLLVEECEHRPPEVSKRQWLAERGIREKQYYYWLRRVRKAAFTAMQQDLLPAPVRKQEVMIAEIPAEGIMTPEKSIPAVVIRTKKSTVEFSSTLSEETLLKLFRTVSHAL